jgi:mono/diheme cytochrome c family protein
MLLSSLPSLAADPTPVPLAEKTYMRYCASCHGKDGTGNGPVARHMKPPPINLTLLSKNNGGQFPYDHVLSVIELRADVPAHGFQDQPVWGDGLSILDQIGPMGAGSENRGKIEALTQYIKSIQQK